MLIHPPTHPPLPIYRPQARCARVDVPLNRRLQAKTRGKSAHPPTHPIPPPYDPPTYPIAHPPTHPPTHLNQIAIEIYAVPKVEVSKSRFFPPTHPPTHPTTFPLTLLHS